MTRIYARVFECLLVLIMCRDPSVFAIRPRLLFLVVDDRFASADYFEFIRQGALRVFAGKQVFLEVLFLGLLHSSAMRILLTPSFHDSGDES